MVIGFLCLESDAQLDIISTVAVVAVVECGASPDASTPRGQVAELRILIQSTTSSRLLKDFAGHLPGR